MSHVATPSPVNHLHKILEKKKHRTFHEICIEFYFTWKNLLILIFQIVRNCLPSGKKSISLFLQPLIEENFSFFKNENLGEISRKIDSVMSQSVNKTRTYNCQSPWIPPSVARCHANNNDQFSDGCRMKMKGQPTLKGEKWVANYVIIWPFFSWKLEKTIGHGGGRESLCP